MTVHILVTFYNLQNDEASRQTEKVASPGQFIALQAFSVLREAISGYVLQVKSFTFIWLQTAECLFDYFITNSR